jgi:hypothetical protein
MTVLDATGQDSAFGCPSCGGPVTSSYWRGRPRRWCDSCLPSINVIGKAEYERRYRLLRRGRPVCGPARQARICAVEGCGLAVMTRGWCATHHARRTRVTES